MSDSSTSQKALEAVQGSRYAGTAQVLGYAEKQAAWLKEAEQRERRAERKVARKKRLRLADKVTAFLVAFALIIGVIIAAVMGIAHLSQEASKNAQVAASASASATPSATPSPTPSSTPSPSPTSASPKPSPKPTEKCLSREERIGTIGGNPESEYCKTQESIAKAKSMLQVAIPLIALLALLPVAQIGARTGNFAGTLVAFIIIIIVGMLLMYAVNNLL
jgi:hypothetical protein